MQYESPSGGIGVEPYVDPDPALGTQGSIVRAPAIENHQRELEHLISHAGLTPNRGDLEQVRQAVEALIAAAIAAATLVAPGTIRASVASSPGPNELLCNGAAVSRATYAALFAEVGITFGAGDGSTTFNVPDFRGRTLIGAGQGTGLALRTLGEQNIGEEAHALSAGEMPVHAHTVATNNFDGSPSGAAAVTVVETAANGTFPTSSAGSGTAHNNMQPSAVVNYFIHT